MEKEYTSTSVIRIFTQKQFFITIQALKTTIQQKKVFLMI
jgi:hypothetical protein